MDEILEDIFVFFKDRLSPIKEKISAPNYGIDFSKISMMGKKVA